MPPVLDKHKCLVDGLAFIGLSLTQKTEEGHEESSTHQTAFDLSRVIDRDYQFVASTNDDGWLVAGGEPGPPKSHKLRAPDSAHVEIIRLGTYKQEWGGVNVKDILATLGSGDILVPSMEVAPTACVANGDRPPELEIRFDMESDRMITKESICNPDVPLPLNWQLRYLHNQLFEKFEFPARFCPGAFHSTIVRKAEFRSEQHKEVYFQRCQAAIAEWKLKGPQPLVPQKMAAKIHVVAPACPKRLQNNWEDPKTYETNRANYKTGVWLFTDRNTITHHILPNFLPPYDTVEKRLLIWEHLRHEWDEKTLSWVNLPESEPRDLEAESSAFSKMTSAFSTMCSSGTETVEEKKTE